MSFPTVLVAREEAVVTLTLNRPERRNAMNGELMRTLLGHLQECEHDEQVRVIVLTGAGTSFCSGADLTEIRDPNAEGVNSRVETSLAIYSLIPSMATPVIAAVNGHAVAGGCGLAMSCDVVVASANAEFGYPEVTRGLVAAFVMVSLSRLVGRRAALELLLTGRRITADNALALGMVTEVAPPEEVLEQALSRARRLAAMSPGAVAMTKRLFNRVADLPYDEALLVAKDANLSMRVMADAVEGARSFLDAKTKEEANG